MLTFEFSDLFRISTFRFRLNGAFRSDTTYTIIAKNSILRTGMMLYTPHKMEYPSFQGVAHDQKKRFRLMKDGFRVCNCSRVQGFKGSEVQGSKLWFSLSNLERGTGNGEPQARFRGSGPKIDMPSASPHSSLPTTEQALEWALVAKQILRQVRIRSLLLLLPSTWNPKPETCEPLPRFLSQPSTIPIFHHSRRLAKHRTPLIIGSHSITTLVGGIRVRPCLF